MKLIQRNSKRIDKNLASELSVAFGIDIDIIEILIARGVDTPEKMNYFLSDSEEYLYDPFLLTDMQRAVNRIKKAYENNEQITIWGDYDVDGTSSAAILYEALKNNGFKEPRFYFPDRFKEGYGLNDIGLDRILKGSETKLLITVDCGITSSEIVKKFRANGVDVIVTDHHNVPSEIPLCTAVIDPKRSGDKYPFDGLCGAGVAFKLVHALFGLDEAMKYIDLAGFATVADVMELKDENRIIVKKAIESINQKPRPAFLELKKLMINGEEDITSSDFGYRFGPAINSCGRLESAYWAFDFLTTQDENEAKLKAKSIYQLNETRKEISSEIKKEAEIFANADKYKRCLISYGTNWHEGVIGIVASHICEKYYKPAIVFSYNPITNEYKGSARSVDGISMYDALKACESSLFKWGGHDKAAGLTVKGENFQDFCTQIQKYMEMINPELFERKVYYDSSIDLSKLNEEFINSLDVLEPTGESNPGVKLLVKDCSLTETVLRGMSGEHYACKVEDENGNKISAIKFNAELPKNKVNLDIVYEPSINHFAGKKNIQMMIDTVIEKKKKNINTEFNKSITNHELDFLNVTNTQKKKFNTAGIESMVDILDYLPRDYVDYRDTTPVSMWKDKDDVAIIAKVGAIIPFKNGSKGFALECITNKNEIFRANFFNQTYLINKFRVNKIYFFSGKAGFFYGNRTMNVKFFSEDVGKYQRLVPIYKKIKNMSDTYLDEKINLSLSYVEDKDYLSEDLLNKYDLITRPEAIRKIHSPEDMDDIKLAQERYLFDTLFKFAFLLELNKESAIGQTDVKFKYDFMTKDVEKSLPYKLTGDQSKAIKILTNTINNDTNRLHALLQGDVGSGKTIVALLLSVLAVENGYQAAIVAPTEVLAHQHYLDFVKTLDDFGINVGYLSGSLKAAEKRNVKTQLKSGAINIVIGTHAVLQDDIEFNKLGFVVIDEQHRFGVVQREKLEQNPDRPHILTMSATPIPRSLATAMLGNHIKVVEIKEKPAGRKDIITKQFVSDDDVNNFMLSEIQKGHQCYVVCPLIEDSTSDKMSSVKSVNQTVKELKEWFAPYPEVNIADITGKMKEGKIAQEIDKFKNNETQILISTTIVEVGVNVPNSTVMVLKNSERFGLAQAHQLRGRVGRGNAQGYMILQTKPDEKKAKILISTSDGFEISKEDLKLRGPGDLLGTVQSGQENNMMLAVSNENLFDEIKDDVSKIISDDVDKEMYKSLLNINIGDEDE